MSLFGDYDRAQIAAERADRQARRAVELEASETHVAAYVLVDAMTRGIVDAGPYSLVNARVAAAALG